MYEDSFGSKTLLRHDDALSIWVLLILLTCIYKQIRGCKNSCNLKVFQILKYSIFPISNMNYQPNIFF